MEERVALLDSLLRPLLGIQGFGYRPGRVDDGSTPPAPSPAAAREARLNRQLDGLGGHHVRVRTVRTSAPAPAAGRDPG